jgi:hypothetical protein
MPVEASLGCNIATVAVKKDGDETVSTFSAASIQAAVFKERRRSSMASSSNSTALSDRRRSSVASSSSATSFSAARSNGNSSRPTNLGSVREDETVHEDDDVDRGDTGPLRQEGHDSVGEASVVEDGTNVDNITRGDGYSASIVKSRSSGLGLEIKMNPNGSIVPAFAARDSVSVDPEEADENVSFGFKPMQGEG